MAQSLTAAENPDHTLCKICKNNMTKKSFPKFLKCHHTFCETCLEGNIKNVSGRHLIICPTCRETTEVKDGKVSNLTANEYLPSRPTVAPKKDICLSCGRPDTTAKYLICKLLLCEECTEKHIAISVFSTHEIEFHHGRKYQCKKHHRDIQYICTQCGLDLCALCVHSSEHADHSDKITLIDLSKMTQNTTEKVNMHMKRLDRKMFKIAKAKTKLEGIKEDVSTKVNRLIKNIKEDEQLFLGEIDDRISQLEALKKKLELSKKSIQDAEKEFFKKREQHVSYQEILPSSKHLDTMMNESLKVLSGTVLSLRLKEPKAEYCGLGALQAEEIETTNVTANMDDVEHHDDADSKLATYQNISFSGSTSSLARYS